MPSPNAGGSTAPAHQTGNPLVDSLISGVRWASLQVSYSFAEVGAAWSTSPAGGYMAGTEPWAGFQSLSAPHRDVVRAAVQDWNNVAALKLAETAESPQQVGDIRFGTSNYLPDNSYAWAHYPAPDPRGGDIWLNGNYSQWIGGQWDKGTYEYFALLHEIGHAIGLKHPHEDPVAMPADHDSRMYTVMSYSSLPGDDKSAFSYYPTTPMVLDIAAIQQIYGADTSVHAGDDTYVFDEYSLYHQTLWDGGGSDTIRYVSNAGGTIHLGEGSASRLGSNVYAFAGNGAAQVIDNIWIARGSVIENAIGGSGDDTLVGNQVANRLDGGKGADLMSGGAGHDTYLVDGNADKVVEAAGGGSDTIITTVDYRLPAHVEHLRTYGSAGLKLTGNGLENLLSGSRGNDTLSSGGGNDHLDGGAGSDRLYAGSGYNTFAFTAKLGKSNVDKVSSFTTKVDHLLLDNAVFTKLGADGSLAKGLLRIGEQARDSNDFLVYDRDDGLLYYDADANGTGKAVLFATLGADTVLATGDIWIG